MITHIVSDWLFSPCCVEHQDEFIFERVAVAYSRDYNEVGRAQINQEIANNSEMKNSRNKGHAKISESTVLRSFMRKPVCICQNKDADQLVGNR